MSSSQPTVRRLEPSDRPAVRKLHEVCFQAELAFDDIVLDRVLRHQNTINLVAELDGEIVGFAAALHGSRPKARLLTIQTHPEARGRGVARSLLETVEQTVRARKARLLELEVHVDNEPAIRLYEDVGFEVEQEDPTAYPSLEETTGYVMHKPLDGGRNP